MFEFLSVHHLVTVSSKNGTVNKYSIALLDNVRAASHGTLKIVARIEIDT